MTTIKHKLFLIVAKWIPVVIAAGILCNNTLATIGIENIITSLLDYIFGVSIAFILSMYICSYVFKFCTWHRIFITYDLMAIVLNFLMTYTDIGNASDRTLLIYHYTLVLIFICIYYYVIHHTKNKENNEQ